MKYHSFQEVVYFQEGPGVRNWQFRPNGVKLINIRNIVDNNIDPSLKGYVLYYLIFCQDEIVFQFCLYPPGKERRESWNKLKQWLKILSN